MELMRFAAGAPAMEVGGTLDDAGALESRLVSGLVAPFDVPVSRPWGSSVFQADGLRMPELLSTVKLLVNHDADRPVGFAVDAQYHDDGLYMTFQVPVGHPRADGYLADLDALLADGFSVGVEMDADTEQAIWAALLEGSDDPVPMNGVVREVSATPIPAYNDARASLAARPLATFAREDTAMPTLTAPTEPDPAPAPPAPDPAPEPPSVGELAARVAQFMNPRVLEPHPLSRFASYADFALAAFADPELARFALVDQVTGNNPGVVPPAWLSTDVAGVIDLGRPGILAMGGAGSLPAAGMELDWPYFDGDLTALVGEQVAQKTDILSVRVDLKKASESIKTFAGGSDVSYQLIRRSSPPYLTEYLRIMNAAYAATTEADFETALSDGAGVPLAVDMSDAEALRGALFGASAAIRKATGSPATAVLAATDMFEMIGTIPSLYPVMYGTQNVSGTAAASTLAVNVSGLTVTEAPYLPDGEVIVSNPAAARFYEDGPFQVSADDVLKLGQNVAIWGMGVTAVKLPKGVVKITQTVTP